MTLIFWTVVLNVYDFVRRLPCLLFGRSRYFRHLSASCRGRRTCAERMTAAYERRGIRVLKKVMITDTTVPKRPR